MRWSEKRRYCERLILSTISIACILLIFIYLSNSGIMKNFKYENLKSYSLQAEKLVDEKCIPVCDSRSCLTQADILLRSIKPSTDPCENFQEFLCGSYEEKFGHDEGNSVLMDMTAKMLNTLKNLLENIEAEPGSSAAKLKIVYESCVNLGSSELRGVEDFRHILNKVGIINWPYLAPDFTFSNSGLATLLATFRSYLQISFLGFVMAPRSENGTKSNERYVKVDFNEHAFKNIQVISRDVVADVLEYFDMKAEEIEILAIDLKVVRNTFLNLAKDGKAYINGCKKNCPHLHFDCSTAIEDEQRHICDMVKVYLNVTNLKQYVKTDEITIEKDYVFHVKNLIPRLKSISDRSVANFFAFNLLWRYLSEINFFFRRKMQKHFKYFTPIENQTATVTHKWKHCISWITNGNMKLVLENELVKSYFRRHFIDEIHNIHQWHTYIVRAMIDDQKWISTRDKGIIRNHIANLECNMAFNQRLLPNDTYVNELYRTFDPTPESFFFNVLNYKRSLLIAFSTLELTHRRKIESTFEASAFTNYLDEIAFHYGFLMPPAYYPGHKKLINFIQLAHIVNHEIGHVIYVRLTDISTHSNITRRIFLERKKCTDKQFSDFKFKYLDENLDGPRYSEENFADNLGYAVTDQLIQNLKPPDVFMLPGLPYSPKQLLYMSTRQAWCSKSSRNIETFVKTIDKHPPSEYRIIASGKNSKKYSKVFNCTVGSYMNPAKKCIFFD